MNFQRQPCRCTFSVVSAIWHLAMNTGTVAHQQFLNANQRLLSLDPPLQVVAKPVQLRSHWHIAYIQNGCRKKGLKVWQTATKLKNTLKYVAGAEINDRTKNMFGNGANADWAKPNFKHSTKPILGNKSWHSQKDCLHPEVCFVLFALFLFCLLTVSKENKKTTMSPIFPHTIVCHKQKQNHNVTKLFDAGCQNKKQNATIMPPNSFPQFAKTKKPQRHQILLHNSLPQ